jgi:hypothetical protein
VILRGLGLGRSLMDVAGARAELGILESRGGLNKHTIMRSPMSRRITGQLRGAD